MGTAVPTWLEAGAGAAGCALLSAGTEVAVATALASWRTGAIWPGIGAAAVAAAFAGAGYAMNCSTNPGAPPPAGGLGGETCPTGTNNKTNIEVLVNGVWTGTSVVGQPVKQLLRVEKDISGTVGYRCKFSRWDLPGEFDSGKYAGSNFRTKVVSCGLPVVPGPTPGPDAYDYRYTTPDGCSVIYKFDDAWIGSDGHPQISWKIEGAPTALMATCQTGRITGYVWSPNTTNNYVFNPEFGFGGGPGDGPLGIWKDITGALVAKLVADLLELQWPGATFRIASACEEDASGEPVDKSVERVIPARPGIPAILDRLDAIGKWTDSTTAPHGGTSMLQALKDFKQPTCERARPKGELVSVRFKSVGVSSVSGQTLRKEFRYRDLSGADQCAHANHWEGFEWEAGPVCVISKNLEWGVPQVWAASAAEGRRVIIHAAAIAGVDVSDPKHRWIVTHSTNPRYGRSGRMVPDRKALNSIWVTKRPGPDGAPEFPVR